MLKYLNRREKQMRTPDLTAIEVPENNPESPIPLMMSLAEASNLEGLRFRGQTYVGSTNASTAEVGDFENDN
jgi:hypothetical protein